LERAKRQENNTRLSDALNEDKYARLSKLAASFDLFLAWMIRRAVSEFVPRYRIDIESDLPLRRRGNMLSDIGIRRKPSDHTALWKRLFVHTR